MDLSEKLLSMPEFSPTSYETYLTSQDKAILKNSILIGKTPKEVADYLKCSLVTVNRYWNEFMLDAEVSEWI